MPEAPLPEGDPDQLLAEASVYLRYGKRDQAIVSLRGILAQDPDHRAALEKLGEAYADDGQPSEAAEVWMRAAEQIRRAGDDDALTALKDRISSLVQSDVDLDVDLDTVTDEVEHGETLSDYDFGVEVEDEDFEIELGEDSVTFVTPPVEAAAQADSAFVEATQPDFTAAEDDDFEIEVDADDFDFTVEDGEEEASVEFDLDVDAPTAPPTGTAAGQTSATAAQIAAELEEAEFYIAQGMHGESRSILERILEKAPDHPAALLRLGEIAQARGEAPDDATDSGVGTGQRVVPELETTVCFGDDENFEVEFDLDFDVEVDLDLDQAEAEVDLSADEASISVEDDVAEEIEVAAEAAEEAMDAAEAPPAPVGDDCFDLREALADVLADDEPAPGDPNGASGVQSTVGDGFESIFADFKRGVSATLDEGDFDTRYDLGIAYREMGLFEDAIGEFRVCLDSAQRRFDSLYLMGLCARDLGRFEDAVSHLEQALALPDLPEDRMAGVYFDLSIAEEGAGDRDRACSSVRRVIEIESDFPGAADRLASLESGQVTSERPGEPSEAFESFDDLFDEDAADEAGDAHVAESVATEAFESCDDTPTAPRKSGRKKISFV